LNRLLFIVLLFFISTGIIAQKLLVVENTRTLKNIKYYQEDNIIIKCPGSDGRITDRIYDMTDTSVIFEIMGEVSLADISCIYREIMIIDILSGFIMLGGVAYFGLDTFNRLINHDDPVVLSETLIISGGMVALGAALIPLRYRKIQTGGKWKLRTIDLNEFQKIN
jgi:hypothetical protein